ncbi:hypothetical protein ES703_88107 [subsurface metagenome]
MRGWSSEFSLQTTRSGFCSVSSRPRRLKPWLTRTLSRAPCRRQGSVFCCTSIIWAMLSEGISALRRADPYSRLSRIMLAQKNTWFSQPFPEGAHTACPIGCCQRGHRSPSINSPSAMTGLINAISSERPQIPVMSTN